MADTIMVRCAKCGYLIGEVSYVPGMQKVGCPKCGKTTIVKIKDDGAVETWKW